MNGIDAVVLDTNAVIEILNDESAVTAFEQRFPTAAVCISIITQIELLGYPEISEDEESQINGFLTDVTVISLDDSIVETAIAIKRNKSKRIKLPDAVIAATAIVHGAALVTRDDDLLKLQYDSFRAWALQK